MFQRSLGNWLSKKILSHKRAPNVKTVNKPMPHKLSPVPCLAMLGNHVLVCFFQCITPDNIFQILRVPRTQGLDRDHFNQACTILLHFAVTFPQRCQEAKLISQKWSYLDFEAKFLSGRSRYSLESLEDFMEGLNKIYKSETPSTGKSCWSMGHEVRIIFNSFHTNQGNARIFSGNNDQDCICKFPITGAFIKILVNKCSFILKLTKKAWTL